MHDTAVVRRLQRLGDLARQRERLVGGQRAARDPIRQVLADPEIQKKFMGYGCIATASTPQEFGAMIAAEIPKWKDVVESARITVQ